MTTAPRLVTPIKMRVGDARFEFARAAPPMATVWQFVRRILHDFRKNQGLLLAGAVAYYALLSLVPLFTLLLVALSHLIDRDRLISTVAANLEFLIPGHVSAITEQVSNFLEHREVVGVVGIAALLFAP